MSIGRKVIFIGTVLVVSVTAVMLGRWQLRRLAARRANNRVQLAARAAAPLVLPGILSAGDSGRHVVAHGRFDTSAVMFIRGRVEDEYPGLQVLTPLVLDSTHDVLWVMRGFVKSPDAVTPPPDIPAPDTGEVAVDGLLMAVPAAVNHGQPLLHAGSTSWAHVDQSAFARSHPGSLPFYLLEGGDSAGPGKLEIVPPPELTNGPHLSYAIQWFGIAIAVFTFGVMMLWRDGRAVPADRSAP